MDITSVLASQNDGSVSFKSHRISDEYGYIDYSYIDKNEQYPNGILVFRGAYIYMPFRNSGKYKELIKKLLKNIPEKTIVQVAIKNKKLIPMFERMNFKRVKKIEYWGEIKVSILMQATLTKEILNLV